MTADRPSGHSRSDAVRNRAVILDAAAATFVESGVQAPVRVIAERAGIGTGTLYRHFPTRGDLVVAVYRQQVDAAAEAGPALLRERDTAADALHAWVDIFVDLLVTKHGLADALSAQVEGADALHRSFVERLVPVCDELLSASAPHGSPIPAYMLMRGIGNLCIGGTAPGYDPARLAHLLVDAAVHPHD